MSARAGTAGEDAAPQRRLLQRKKSLLEAREMA
jgi:hypothetical protein